MIKRLASRICTGRSQRLALVALTTSFLLAGCEFGEPSIAISPVPTVTASVQDGLQAFRGKVVILDFWATWCGPCRAEIPGFVKLQEKYREKGLEIIGVSIDPIAPQGGGAPAVEPFMRTYGINYTVWLVNSAEAMQGYDVSRGIPTTYVLDRSGKVVKSYVGMPPKAEQVFEDAVKQLL